MNQMKVASVVGLVMTLVAAGCSGESFDPGPTVVTGSITLPAADKCIDPVSGRHECTVGNDQVVTFQPVEGGGRQTTNPELKTSASGVFNTGDLTSFLTGIGGGQQTIISVAIVANSTGSPEFKDQTRIGGLVPLLQTGAVASKDFNPTTHIACAAGVFLTGQMVTETTPPCANQIRQLGFIDANLIDLERTNILEQASSEIAGDVVFPTQVACGACAVIVCTRGGLCSTEGSCMADAFDRCASDPMRFDVTPVSCGTD